ncbi:lysylphosphatidylglycerol synthase transmembrane domain-containing protein [Pseudothermotoga lettingae]|uniref:Integral membrane protein-like protein n=1 Tax=Pseudothermotoga lettingae (strain ATCC BAA-301 / DSM 14385 / NBRC 107922 / TMO) TaxID=416591 RepID=A8F404_PSELT|nr:lysylphosphatidylglycerol synthase transmembrane domain-containing protein [Pseudothermotoga lettingae]ABV32888.1 conserved hypothetical protein 374 [Pseudothermotoga lettingae TMO]GLI48113.1 TIGR00374 family protein [Pseudothermotoga lettingae TMO]
MKTKIFLGVILSLGASGLISFLVSGNQIISALEKMNLWYFLLACFMYLLFLVLDSLRTKLLLSHAKINISYLKCFQNTLLGLYTSAVTPFSAGGQPFQIYHLNKNGVPVEAASMTIGVKFISSFTLMVFSTFFLLLIRGKSLLTTVGSTLLVYSGLVLTSSIYLFFLLLIFSKPFAQKIIMSRFFTRIVSILTKKDPKAVWKKAFDSLSNYFELLRGLWISSKLIVLITVIITFFNIIITASLPYIISISFGLSEIDYLQFVCAFLTMSMVVYFVPTPGSSGGIEGAFYLMFKNLSSSEFSVATMLIWRLITYYAILIIGSLSLSKMIFSSKQTKQL